MFIPGGVIELGDCDTLNRLEASVKFHNSAYAIFASELILNRNNKKVATLRFCAVSAKISASSISQELA